MSYFSEQSTLGALSQPQDERTTGSLNKVKVLVITSGHDAADPRIYAKQACSLSRMGAEVIIVGRLEGSIPGEVKVMIVPKPSSRLVRFLWQPWRCLWEARRQRPDIIHFHDAEMLMTLPVAKLWWPASSFVYDVHEDFGNLMLIRNWLPSWLKPAVRVVTDRLEKAFASFADAVVGVTPPLTNKFPHKNKITAYNYNSREFLDRAILASRRAPDREFDLVHLGTLSLRRAMFLAETIRELHRLRPGARSIIIGASSDIERAIAPRLPDGCVQLGKTPYKEIPRLLGNAKVGLDVHPWLDLHLEVALPVKVCEYMAAGCAVVSSAMPVLTRVLAEAKADPESLIILKDGGPVDYAKAVLHLLEAIESGVDPGSKLRETVSEHMSWEGEASKIARLYLRLLGKTCTAT